MLFASLLAAAVLVPGARLQEDPLAEARALLGQSALADAAAAVQGALEAGRVDARDASLLLAEIQVAEGRPKDAVATLDALSLPDDHDVRLGLAAAYLAWADELHADGRSDDARILEADARQHYERASRVAPAGDVRALVEVGNVDLYRMNDHARAMALADEALAAHAGNGELLLLRGCAGVHAYWHASQGDDAAATQAAWQKAVDDLLAADAKLPPDRVEPWVQLAWLYETKGEANKAVDAAIEVLDRDPQTTFDELYRLALTYASARPRQLEAASRALQKMVTTSARDLTVRIGREDDPTAVATELSWAVGPLYNRGTQDGKIAARLILEAITRANPKNAVVWDNYAVLCQETGEFEQALEAYNRRLQLDDSDPRTYNDIAAILAHDLRREPERARELYEKCIAMADEQLAATDLDPARRSHLTLARNTARDNLGSLQSGSTAGRPAASGGGLLDALREGLRNIDVPAVPAEGEQAAQGGGEGGAGGGEGQDGGAGGAGQSGGGGQAGEASGG